MLARRRFPVWLLVWIDERWMLLALVVKDDIGIGLCLAYVIDCATLAR